MICFPVISFACSYSASKKKVIKEPRTDGHVKAYGMIVTYSTSRQVFLRGTATRYAPLQVQPLTKHFLPIIRAVGMAHQPTLV